MIMITCIYNPQIQISEKSQTKRIEIADSRKTKRPKIDKRTTPNKRHSNAIITLWIEGFDNKKKEGLMLLFFFYNNFGTDYLTIPQQILDIYIFSTLYRPDAAHVDSILPNFILRKAFARSDFH